MLPNKSPVEQTREVETPTNQMGVQTSIQPSLYADKSEEKGREGKRIDIKLSSNNLAPSNTVTADKIYE